VGIAIAVIVFFLYIGPGLLRWLLGSTEHHLPDPLASCLEDKLGRWAGLLAGGNGHVTYKRPAGDGGDEEDLLHYVGNGYIGMAVNPDSDLNIKSKRTLSSVVRYKPIVQLSLEGGEEEAATVTDYKNGVVHLVQCLAHDRQDRDPVVVTTAVYAHRTLPTVMVQDVKIYNPGSRTVRIDVEKGGISDWESAVSVTRVVEHRGWWRRESCRGSWPWPARNSPAALRSGLG